MTKGVNRNSWIILKQAWNIAASTSNSHNQECGNTTFGYYNEILVKFFGMSRWNDDIAFYCLISKANADEQVGSTQTNPFEDLSPQEVLIPEIYRYEVEYLADDYEYETYYDECHGETSYEYEMQCECRFAEKEVYDEELEEWGEEECDYGEEDCECIEWEDAAVELYWWNDYKGIFYSLQNDLIDDGCSIDCLRDDYDTIIFEEDEDEMGRGYDDRTTWDYFSDNIEGEIIDWSMEDTSPEVRNAIE
tara:strand:- start:2146 stop:2889 length:744 start_codon:yes stop_codon:yes gene_type:complete